MKRTTKWAAVLIGVAVVLGSGWWGWAGQQEEVGPPSGDQTIKHVSIVSGPATPALETKAAEPLCVGISLGVRIYPGTRLAAHVAAQGPMAHNPALWGKTADNEQLLAPVFYLSPQLGSPQQAAGFLEEAIAVDQRFFFGGSGDESDYDYDDNQVLVAAIAAGARGAYWDILRRVDRSEEG